MFIEIQPYDSDDPKTINVNTITKVEPHDNSGRAMITTSKGYEIIKERYEDFLMRLNEIRRVSKKGALRKKAAEESKPLWID